MCILFFFKVVQQSNERKKCPCFLPLTILVLYFSVNIRTVVHIELFYENNCLLFFFFKVGLSSNLLLLFWPLRKWQVWILKKCKQSFRFIIITEWSDYDYYTTVRLRDACLQDSLKNNFVTVNLRNLNIC